MFHYSILLRRCYSHFIIDANGWLKPYAIFFIIETKVTSFNPFNHTINQHLTLNHCAYSVLERWFRAISRACVLAQSHSPDQSIHEKFSAPESCRHYRMSHDLFPSYRPLLQTSSNTMPPIASYTYKASIQAARLNQSNRSNKLMKDVLS